MLHFSIRLSLLPALNKPVISSRKNGNIINRTDLKLDQWLILKSFFGKINNCKFVLFSVLCIGNWKANYREYSPLFAGKCLMSVILTLDERKRFQGVLFLITLKKRKRVYNWYLCYSSLSSFTNLGKWNSLKCDRDESRLLHYGVLENCLKLC